jgi:hypothetical protein
VAQAVAVVVACIAFFAGAASASPITLVSVERYVNLWGGFVNGCCDSVTVSADDPLGPFSATATLHGSPFLSPGVSAELEASQDTTISDSAFGGSVGAVTPGSPASDEIIFSGSYLGVTFDVDAPATYTWNGTMTFEGSGMQQVAYLVDVTANTSVLFIPYEALVPGSPNSFFQTGSLIPGHRYKFEQGAGGQVLLSPTGNSASWTFEFTVAPEPGTASLVGLGLVLLARASRRRN